MFLQTDLNKYSLWIQRNTLFQGANKRHDLKAKRNEHVLQRSSTLANAGERKGERVGRGDARPSVPFSSLRRNATPTVLLPAVKTVAVARAAEGLTPRTSPCLRRRTTTTSSTFSRWVQLHWTHEFLRRRRCRKRSTLCLYLLYRVEVVGELRHGICQNLAAPPPPQSVHFSKPVLRCTVFSLSFAVRKCTRAPTVWPRGCRHRQSTMPAFCGPRRRFFFFFVCSHETNGWWMPPLEASSRGRLDRLVMPFIAVTVWS